MQIPGLQGPEGPHTVTYYSSYQSAIFIKLAGSAGQSRVIHFVLLNENFWYLGGIKRIHLDGQTEITIDIMTSDF